MTTKELVLVLRHCTSRSCIGCPLFTPPKLGCWEMLSEVADRLEELGAISAEERVIDSDRRVGVHPKEKAMQLRGRITFLDDPEIGCFATDVHSMTEVLVADRIEGYKDGWWVCMDLSKKEHVLRSRNELINFCRKSGAGTIKEG